MVIQKPRAISAQILLRHSTSHAFIEELVDRELAGTRMPGSDRALIQELCYGCVRWRATLDWLIRSRTRERPTLSAAVFLRLGLYQIFWLSRIPDHACVNETVEAAREIDPTAPIGFLNAILRNHLREVAGTRAALDRLRLEDPALGWSHPGWLVNRWKARFAPDTLQALLNWNNTPAQTYARINTLKADPGEVIEAWRNEGVDYDFARHDWIGENLTFLLKRHPSIDRLVSFKEGGFYIQDPSTLLSVSVLAPKPGERILDLCAAPGGKATFLAQCVDNEGQILAADSNPARRDRLRSNCDRLAADVTIVHPDDPQAAGPFDAVLVDAPCSNTGVLRRRIDARWRLTPSELTRCRALQEKLLASAARRVGPAGRLVYSTCSLEPEENSGVVRVFLASHPGWRLASERTLDPVTDHVDGAYVARLERA